MKTMLEERIMEKAEKRFDKECRDIKCILETNIITKKLNFIINNNERCPYYPDSFLESAINFKEAKKEIISEYVEEETDKILSELSILNEFLTQESEQ